MLLDVQMPGMNGTTVLRRARDVDPHVAVIMITSVDEIDTVREALKSGAGDYLLKPLDFPMVLETIDRALEQRTMQLELVRYREQLEVLVYDRTRDLECALKRTKDTYTQTILALGAALETRDVETQAHSRRVAGYTMLLCRGLGIDDAEKLTAVERGAYLHDIGKIGVPDQILLKPDALTPEEWVVMKQHPFIGVQLLKDIDFLKQSLAIVRSHHERWDGLGYPDGLSGTEIPLEARAFAVADALDAITSDRPYRKGQSVQVARELVAKDSGTQFDPAAVEVLRQISDAQIDGIRRAAISSVR